MQKSFSNIFIISIIAAVVLIGTGVGGYLVWNRSVRCDAVFPGVTNLKDVSIIYTEGTMTGSQKIVISGEGQSFLLSDFRSDTPAVHARVGVITEDKLRNLLDIFEDGGFVCMKEYYDYPRSLRPTDLAQETVILHINDFTRKVSEYGGSGPSALHRITGQILAVGKDLNPIAKGEERKFCSDMISTILKIKEDISSFAKWCERALNISSLTVGGSDFSDWKTYRNEKYGFEVRYPSGWVVDEWSRAGELAGFEFHQKGVDYPKFEIDLFRALGPRTPPTYTNRETIFGKEVGINEYECLGNGWCKDVELIIEPVSLPGGNDVFGWYLRTSDLSKKDLLNQILSTFKFVE